MVTDGTSSEDILAAYEALDEEFYTINNAYAIASLFSSMDTSDEYYSSEEELLAAYKLCPRAGLIDGITREPTLSEDGFPMDYILKLRNDLENLT